MKIWVAKFLELLGMVILLSGLFFGISYSLIKFELAALGIGCLVFYIGWLLEKRMAS